jgi:hypothetical protein
MAQDPGSRVEGDQNKTTALVRHSAASRARVA